MTFSKRRPVTDMLPIRYYDDKTDSYVLDSGKRLDLLQLTTKDLSSISEDQLQTDIYKYTLFYRTYVDDCKVIATNYPVDTKEQQSYLQYKLSKTKDRRQAQLLEDKLEQLVATEEERAEREYFLMTFADSVDMLYEQRDRISQTLMVNGLAGFIDAEKKHQVLSKLANKATCIYLPHHRIEPAFVKNRKRWSKEQFVEKLGYDPYLLATIQPQGGIDPQNSRYTLAGDGYEACLEVYDYKSTVSNRLNWLATLMNVRGAVVTMDVMTVDKAEAKRNINKSVDEQIGRIYLGGGASDVIEAAGEKESLERAQAEITYLGEILKAIRVRLYVTARTLESLDEQCGNIATDLEGYGFRAAIYLNQGAQQWKAMYQPVQVQQEQPMARQLQPVLAAQLAQGDPFHFNALKDPQGTLWGYTLATGGSVLWDMYLVNSRRMSYGGLCCGLMGSGKSTFLKKIVEDQFARGNRVRISDASGEFRYLVEQLGGQVISLDRGGSIINMLEILKTNEDDRMSYMQHISKLRTAYRTLTPVQDYYELDTFEKIVREFYEDWGLVPGRGKQIAGLAPDQYPIWSDLLRYIDARLQKRSAATDAVSVQLETDEMRRLYNVQLTISNLVKTYGPIVDGHTNVPNIMSSRVVSFETTLLKQLPAIENYQMVAMLSLCRDDMMQFGLRQKALYEAKKTSWEDIVRTALLIDESHRYLNAKNTEVLDIACNIAREDRKYFGSLWLAAHNMRDYVPQGSSSEGVDKLTTLFELTQHKVIFRQDANSRETISQIFRGQFTEVELDQLTAFEKGECVMAISGDRNITFKVALSDEEDERFRGGA